MSSAQQIRPATCPQCASIRSRVTTTPGDGIRWHKCQDCGETFKSINAIQLWVTGAVSQPLPKTT